MTRRSDIVLLSALLGLAGCQDIRRALGWGENAVMSAAATTDIEDLCQLAGEQGDDATFETLMPAWDPLTPAGENVKDALEVLGSGQRYEALRHTVQDPEWSCPELEAALAR